MPYYDRSKRGGERFRERYSPLYSENRNSVNDYEGNPSFDYYYDETNYVGEGQYYNPETDNYEYYQLPEERNDFYAAAYRNENFGDADEGREYDTYEEFVRHPYRRKYTAYKETEPYETSAMGGRYNPRNSNNRGQNLRGAEHGSEMYSEGAGYASMETVRQYGIAGNHRHRRYKRDERNEYRSYPVSEIEAGHNFYGHNYADLNDEFYHRGPRIGKEEEYPFY